MEKELLYKGADRFGIVLTEEQVKSLLMFINLLVEWNSKINLTGISSRSRIITELLLDSMIPVPFLPQKGELVDLGSGAGFPALIIKILRPDLGMRLIESNGKKVSFLKHAIRSLHLKDITPVNDRIEIVTKHNRPWCCNVVTSRAMASFEKIVQLSDSFLAPDGIIVGFLGGNGEDELKKIQTLFLKNNLSLKDSITYNLPGKESERTIVILQKESC